MTDVAKTGWDEEGGCVPLSTGGGWLLVLGDGDRAAVPTVLRCCAGPGPGSGARRLSEHRWHAGRCRDSGL